MQPGQVKSDHSGQGNLMAPLQGLLLTESRLLMGKALDLDFDVYRKLLKGAEEHIGLARQMGRAIKEARV